MGDYRIRHKGVALGYIEIRDRKQEGGEGKKKGRVKNYLNK